RFAATQHLGRFRSEADISGVCTALFLLPIAPNLRQPAILNLCSGSPDRASLGFLPSKSLRQSLRERMLHRDRLAGFQVAHRQLGVWFLGLEKSRRLDRQLLPVAVGARRAVDRNLVAGARDLHFRRFSSGAISQTKRAPPKRGSVASTHQAGRRTW